MPVFVRRVGSPLAVRHARKTATWVVLGGLLLGLSLAFGLGTSVGHRSGWSAGSRDQQRQQLRQLVQRLQQPPGQQQQQLQQQQLVSLDQLMAAAAAAGRRPAGQGGTAGGAAAAQPAALYEELMRRGMLSVSPEAAKQLDRMVADRLLFVGAGEGAARSSRSSSDGEVVGEGAPARLRVLQAPCRGGKRRAGYLMICTKLRDHAWAVNEWLAYHLLLGVEHISFLVDAQNSDNIEAVLAPWREFVSVETGSTDLNAGLQRCFDTFSPNYTWIAFTGEQL